MYIHSTQEGEGGEHDLVFLFDPLVFIDRESRQIVSSMLFGMVFF
jgi:hypothetical protein